MKRQFTAFSIFEDYMRLENRIPSKDEWDEAWYGRKLRRGESNYYYIVRRKWLAEKEKECDA